MSNYTNGGIMHMHKTQNGKMLGAAISGPALDNLLKLGQAIAGALTIYLPAMCGHPAVPPVP